MRFGARTLFEDVTTTFIPGRRYGLTGPNGAGKTTFMKILSGEGEPQKGTVTRPKRLGVLRQDQFAFDAFRVIDTVIMGNKGLWKALQERDAIYEKAEMTDADGMRVAELEGIVREALDAQMAERGVSEQRRQQVLGVLDQCDVGRFSPGGGDAARSRVLEDAAAAMEGWR